MATGNLSPHHTNFIEFLEFIMEKAQDILAERPAQNGKIRHWDTRSRSIRYNRPSLKPIVARSKSGPDWPPRPDSDTVRRALKEQMATKADLASLKEQMATKKDMESVKVWYLVTFLGLVGSLLAIDAI